MQYSLDNQHNWSHFSVNLIISEISISLDVQDHMKCDENMYLGINELKDGNHINGKISRTGVSDKQLASLFTDQSNFYNQQHGGMNGFVNGQGILPTPPSINNKNFIKNPNIINGDIDMSQPLKTEGLSTRYYSE